MVTINSENNPEQLVGSNIDNYLITKYINQGSFGVVFEAKDTKTDSLVALKIPIQTETKNGEKWLLEEVKVYNSLNKKSQGNQVGIANMKVIKNKDKKIIVMDLLGESLESLLRIHKKLRLKSIILLSIQLIDTMKYIHSCGWIHRDIKADNFVIGYDNPNKIYCIDFGLAKKYTKRGSDNEHIKFNKNYKFCGTARYASLAAHAGHEQSRKDDLEAIGYLLIYLFRGSLPWQNIKHKDKKEKYRLIEEKKKNITDEDLCDKLPKEFLVYMKYVKNLDFDEKPHYTALRRMFQKLYNSKGYMLEKFEWQK
jgi:casein kinase I family protein HRR25